MPNQNLTEIIFLVDRSGSMSSIKADMEGGFKTFVEEQKADPSPCRVSLFQFDDKYDVVYENISIQEQPDLVLEPRGMTALLDGLGKTINGVGARYAAIAEGDRPGRVVFVVITDGHENASKEFTIDKIKEMVTLQQDTYKWQFVFLGANIDSFATGTSYGFHGTSTLDYAATSAGTARGYAVLSNAVRSYRTASADDVQNGAAVMDMAAAADQVDASDGAKKKGKKAKK